MFPDMFQECHTKYERGVAIEYDNKCSTKSTRNAPEYEKKCHDEYGEECHHPEDVRHSYLQNRG